MAHARAAAAAPVTGDFRRPRRSSRTSGAVRSTQNSRDFRREAPSIRLCPCVDKTTHAQAESHQKLELLPGHREREGHRRLGNMDAPGHRGRGRRGRLLASNRLLLVNTDSRGKNPAPGLAGDCRPPPAIPMAVIPTGGLRAAPTADGRAPGRPMGAPRGGCLPHAPPPPSLRPSAVDPPPRLAGLAHASTNVS